MKRRPVIHNGRNQRRMADILRQWLNPVLLAIVIYFVKPVFDKFPDVEKKLDALTNQQQEMSETLDMLQPEVQRAVTKIEVLDVKVNRIEKKVD